MVNCVRTLFVHPGVHLLYTSHWIRQLNINILLLREGRSPQHGTFIQLGPKKQVRVKRLAQEHNTIAHTGLNLGSCRVRSSIAELWVHPANSIHNLFIYRTLKNMHKNNAYHFLTPYLFCKSVRNKIKYLIYSTWLISSPGSGKKKCLAACFSGIYAFLVHVHFSDFLIHLHISLFLKLHTNMVAKVQCMHATGILFLYSFGMTCWHVFIHNI